MRNHILDSAFLLAWVVAVTPAAADTFSFSTGSPDGLIATLSRTASPGKLETETADDFVTTAPTIINSATFTGLLPSGTPLSAVNQVEIELYHVFPIDSGPPDGRVLTRMNSPSDNNFDARDSAVPGQLSFTTTLLNPSFHVLNSVVNGINPLPNQFTGGDGPVTGEEVQFNITFTTPFVLNPNDHVFFRPEVNLSAGDFLWLSAPKPIVPPGTSFTPDLQTWIRNDGAGALAPDWSRIGTDITHQGPFNASFSLTGSIVPEPATWVMMLMGFAGLGFAFRRSKRRVSFA